MEFFQQLETIDPLQLEGIENLQNSLNAFINNMSITMMIDKTNSFIRLYKSATLASTDIIRADPSYNNTPWFSDVSIVMEIITDTTTYVTDHGICFGKVST